MVFCLLFVIRKQQLKQCNYSVDQSGLLTGLRTDFTSSVWNFCRWVTDVPPREMSPAAKSEEKGMFSQANEIYGGMETSHFDSKSFWYELKQWNFAKSLITSRKVCVWTRKTFWVFHSLSQVCETTYRYIHRLKLFDNWINCNCCCCWYTSKERNCIETTCIWKDFESKQPVTIGVCLPREDAKEKISRPF